MPGESCTAQPVWVLLPLKTLSEAKQRLAAVMTPQQRQGLFLAMVQDVLSVLQAHPEIERVLLVSSDPLAGQLATHYGASWLPEAGGSCGGLNRAVRAGMQYLAGLGVDQVLVLPGDLPLLSQHEVSRLLSVHRHAYRQGCPPSRPFRRAGVLTLVADQRREGTNCLLCSPASGMSFHYGPGSLRAHKAAGRQAGLRVQEMRLEGAACDIDTPQDLDAFMRRTSRLDAIHTLRFISQFRLAEQLRHYRLQADGLAPGDGDIPQSRACL